MEKEINPENTIPIQKDQKKDSQEESFDINKIYDTLKRRKRMKS